MALPHCHSFFQFYVGCEDNINRPNDLLIVGTNNDNDLNKHPSGLSDGDVRHSLPKYLDCILHQRSADMFLGVPFNIASYALLMSIIGQLTGLIPRYFTHNLGDCLIKHLKQAQEQIERTPYPLCNLKFMSDLKDIDDIKPEDIIIEDYKSHPIIKADMII
jgi:thymidylate synthase